ncbi:hypothetical protein F4777DRAFT_23961 [Nemania sp. FL0916]|nr:hypothetical protein F4777DRAFT_23961 [Nemania sp. FL0916]
MRNALPPSSSGIALIQTLWHSTTWGGIVSRKVIVQSTKRSRIVFHRLSSLPPASCRTSRWNPPQSFIRDTSRIVPRLRTSCIYSKTHIKATSAHILPYLEDQSVFNQTRMISIRPGGFANVGDPSSWFHGERRIEQLYADPPLLIQATFTDGVIDTQDKIPFDFSLST